MSRLLWSAVCCALVIGSAARTQEIRPAGSPHFALQAGDAAGSIVAISHDGAALAVAQPNRITFIDVTRNRQRARIDTSASVTAMAFAPDDTLVAAGTSEGTVELWPPDGARRMHTLLGPRVAIAALAFGVDGRSLTAAAEDGSTVRWALPGGSLLGTKRPPLRRNESMEGVALSGNGEWVAAISGDLSEWPAGARLEISRPRADAPPRRLDPPQHLPNAVAVSADGRWVAAGTTQSIVYVWDTTAGTPAREIDTRHWVMSVDFSPDGRRLAVGSMPADEAGGLELFDTATGRSLWSVAAHLDVVRSAAFSRDGRVVASVSDDGTTRVWDADSGSEKWFAAGYTGTTGIAFSPDGQLLAAASAGQRIRAWDTRTWKELAPFESPCHLTSTIVFGPSGRELVAGDRCTTIKIWDVATRRLARTIAGDQVHSLDVSPDERFLAWADNARQDRPGWMARVADFRTGSAARQVAPIPAEYAFGAVAFTPAGDLLTADGRTVALRDWKTSATRWSVSAEAAGRPVLLSTDRFVVHVGNDVQVRSIDGGAIVRAFVLPGCGDSLAASRDGRWLACGGVRIAGGTRQFSDHVVTVFDAGSGEIVRTFSGHTDSIDAVAFSPDGKWIVSGARDRSLRVWDVSTLAGTR